MRSAISIQSEDNARSALVNCLCPECGGAIEPHSNQLGCLGRCGKQWRAIWDGTKRDVAKADDHQHLRKNRR
jgi:hypothetical protein